MTTARTASTASGDPEAAGLDPGRLAKLGAVLRREVDQGRLPGAVVMIARHGRVAHTEVVGWRDVAAREPLREDAIFRIYSMTKVLTSVMTMALVEEGALRLSDPAARYLPALGGARVLRVEGRRSRLEAAEREMTVHDLLRHTSGIVGGVSGSEPVSGLYRKAGIVPYDHVPAAYETSSQDLVEAIGRLPLAHHPGTVWEYSRSGDVLGRLLEVAADRPLDELLEERLLRPLGMADTSFWLRPGTSARAAQPLAAADIEQPGVIDLTGRPRFVSGGSGALSTAADFLRFCGMLLGGGALDAVRLLGRKTAELMASDHLGPLAESGPDYIPGPGYGFGLGLAVRTRRGPSMVPGSPGELWWLGRAATSFVVDPAEGLVAVAMTQKYAQARAYQALFKTLVLQAIAD